MEEILQLLGYWYTLPEKKSIKTMERLGFERFPHSSGSRFVDVDAHKLGTLLEDVNKVQNQRENQPPLPSFHLQPVSQISARKIHLVWKGWARFRRVMRPASSDEARVERWDKVYPIFFRDKSKHTRKKQIMNTKKRWICQLYLKAPRVHFYYNLWKAQLTSTKPSLEKTMSSVSLHGRK